MLPRNNDQVIERYLNEMLQRIGDGNLELQEVKEQVKNLRSEYEEERERAKNGSPDQKKAFERRAEALAGALPGVTKGTLESISAFRKSPPDVVVGSAAIMDICASLASTLGSLSAAGGPPGALLGAMFSMVSMILRFFAPEPPSLLSQIEEMLRTLQFETKKSEIIAAQKAVFVYVNGCDEFMKRDPEGRVQDPLLLAHELAKFNLVEGNTITTIRTVQEWLLQDGNWDLEGWPEILNLLCQVYMYLVLAVTRQDLYANDQKIIQEYVGGHPSREQAWAVLQREMTLKRKNLSLNNEQQLSFLKEILPVARKRGTFIVALPNHYVFAATGPKALQQGTWGHPIFNNCRKVSVVPGRDGVDHPNPTYDVWVLAFHRAHYGWHNELAVRTRTLTDPASDDVGPQGANWHWLDWWPLPAAGGTFTIYAARSLENGGEVAAYAWNPADPQKVGDPTRFPWIGRRIVSVRIATPSVDALPGDPDGPTTQPYALNGNNIIYATVEGSTEIWAWQEGTGTGLVPISMKNYRGLAVDPHCVWVYGEQGLACATHASVQAFLQKKRATPNWLGLPRNNKTQVMDLSVCGDGTLTLYIGELWNGLYRIDFGQSNPEDRLTVEWEKYSDLRGASQVQKLRILGWQLIDSSIQSLTEPARNLARPSYLLN